MVKILFVHPDLGIGGAERLVVDAALALQQKGHSVQFLTNHHDRAHCFEETRDGTLPVETVGDWLPRNIFGKLYALCAYIRMVYAACYTVLCLARKEHIDIIFCDIVSLGIPIFKFAKHKPKIVFYCHFPDQLLSQPGSWLKRCYRKPLNYLEEITTGQADSLLVNSKFTRGVFKDTFRGIRTTPDVLYPSLNTAFFDGVATTTEDECVRLPEETFVFLSINRYERKKNLSLALDAMKVLETSVTRHEWDRTFLIVCGGYDARVTENVEYFDELSQQVADLRLTTKVAFLKSPSDTGKLWLLRRCQTLLYTPANEHFGIVPLEAMYMRKPVIAVNSGGPTETIIGDSTGFLCEPTPEGFAKAMTRVVKERGLIERMGEMGRKRVQQRFSFEAFANKLDCVITDLMLVNERKHQ